jgi:Ca-activated chloride channel family protein
MGYQAGRHRWRRLSIASAVVVAVGLSYVGVRVLRTDPAAAATCAGGSRTVTMGVDPAELVWAADLVSAYNAEHRSVAGLCAALAATALPLNTALAAFQPTANPTGPPPPEIWLPASTASVDLLRATPGGRTVVPQSSPSIASSPLVLAAPAAALDAITAAKGRLLGFGDYLNLTRDPRGWAAVGEPRWGRLVVTSADPQGSNTGVSLFQAVAAASAGVPLELATAQTFANPAALLGLLGFTAKLGRTTNDPDQLFAAASSMASESVVIKTFGLIAATEERVYRYNLTSRGVPMRAAYPFGGTYSANFPVVALNGPWVDGFAHLAAFDFANWARSPVARQRLARAGLRAPDGSLTTPDAAERGLNATPLPPKPSTAEGLGAARGLWNLFSKGTSTLVVLDTSGSMGETVPGTDRTRLALVQQALATAFGAFGATLRDTDQLGLWEFSTNLDGGRDYRPVVPIRPVAGLPNNTALSQQVLASLAALTPHDATGLYDTVLAAYLDAQRHYLKDGFNEILLLTDGRNDDRNGIDLATLLAELAKHRDPKRPVHLLTFAIGGDTDPAVLGEISRAADGLSYQSKDLSNLSSLIFTALIALANT